MAYTLFVRRLRYEPVGDSRAARRRRGARAVGAPLPARAAHGGAGRRRGGERGGGARAREGRALRRVLPRRPDAWAEGARGGATRARAAAPAGRRLRDGASGVRGRRVRGRGVRLPAET